MAKSKLINCKACGAEIARSAKHCPNCGAKNKKGHPILIGILVVFLFVIIIAAASGNDDEVQKVASNDQLPAATSSIESSADKSSDNSGTFSIGETAEYKNIQASLVSVTESTGSQFLSPSDGNVFVLCEFEIANNSNSELSVSSLLSFDAYCDDYTCNLSLSALADTDKNQLDGSVAAGKKMNGVIGYEVPSDWQELEIHFSPDVWSGKDMIFIVSND